MAEVVLNKIIRLGLVKGHQATIYEAYEKYENGVVTGPLFKSGDDTENLLGRKFPLIKEDGTYYPPSLPFVLRVKIKADDKYTDWFYITECSGKCHFDYTLPAYFCEGA